METILFNISTKSKNTGTNYRLLYRIAVITSLVLSCVIGLMAGYIKYTPKTVVIQQTESTKAITEEVAQIESVAQMASTEPHVFFALTPAERTLIEQVVSAESRGEPYDGQVAVSQCILNACLKNNITPERAIEKYKYTSNRAEPTDSVKEAVAAVFDRGEGVTSEPILYFYAPKMAKSDFHESQEFVVEIANHRFFKEDTRQ